MRLAWPVGWNSLASLWNDLIPPQAVLTFDQRSCCHGENSICGPLIPYICLKFSFVQLEPEWYRSASKKTDATTDHEVCSANQAPSLLTRRAPQDRLPWSDYAILALWDLINHKELYMAFRECLFAPNLLGVMLFGLDALQPKFPFVDKQ